MARVEFARRIGGPHVEMGEILHSLPPAWRDFSFFLRAFLLWQRLFVVEAYTLARKQRLCWRPSGNDRVVAQLA
jgi:hypothetical protein